MQEKEQFTRTAEVYMDTVFRVALNYLRDPVESEDVTQNVFEKLLRQRKVFHGPEHLKYWLIRVTINECRHVLRSPWRKQESLEAYAASLEFENPGRSDLFRAVMGLPKKYRLPIYLHYYEGYTTQEIASILKIPKNTVCTNLRRGRQQLKQELQEADNNV